MPPKASRRVTRRSVRVQDPNPEKALSPPATPAAGDAIGCASDDGGDIITALPNAQPEERSSSTHNDPGQVSHNLRETRPEPTVRAGSKRTRDAVDIMSTDTSNTSNLSSSGSTGPTISNQDSPAVPANAEAGTPIPSLPRPAFRYKPRTDVVRRSKEELEARKRLEDERLQERIAEAGRNNPDSQKSTRGQSSGTRGRPRSRGDARTNKSRENLASGPLGEWSASPASPARPGSNLRGETRVTTTTSNPSQQLSRTTSSAVKQDPGLMSSENPRKPSTRKHSEPKPRPKTSRSEQTSGAPHDEFSDNDTFQGVRKSIEYISLVSDEEESDEMEDITTQGRRRSSTRDTVANLDAVNRPIRVRRIEHVKRKVAVNHDPSILADTKDKLKKHMNDPRASSITNTEKGKTRDVEFIGEGRRQNEAHEDQTLIKGEPSDPMGLDAEPTGQAKVAPTTRSTKREDENLLKGKAQARRNKSTFKEAKWDLQTREDREEWERTKEVMQELKGDLLSLHSQHSEPPKPDRAGLPPIYHFQFPPLMPNLIPRPTIERMHIADPEAAATLAPTTRESNSPAVKIEEDKSAKKFITAADAEVSGGYVGKLKVHKSGRVTLDWGGTPFEVGTGVDIKYLQDVVVVPRTEEGDMDQNVHCVGQIRRKLIVTPDWDELLR